MNSNQYLLLFVKYAPTFLKIIQTDAPTFEVLIKDLRAIQAGQPVSTATPPVPTTFSTTFPPG